MQEEEKMNKGLKIDASKTTDQNSYKKTFLEVIYDTPTKQKAFFSTLPGNIDLSIFFKALDQQNIFLESEDVFKALFLCAEVCNKPFPFSLFLLDWSNKRAQLNFVSFILDKKIDLGSSSGLSRIIKPDYITDSVYYLNSVELFKCIANLNNRSLIMKIKQECPEMCVLGLSHVLPKFSDIFDELFLRTIDKYRQLNSHYTCDKSNSSQNGEVKNSFYTISDFPIHKSSSLFMNPPSIILQAQREELKIIEKQSYILNILLIQKKVIHKLSLVPLNIALNLIIENNCFEQVLSLNSDLSYNILILGYQIGLYDLRTILIYRVKNDLFIHNLLVFLMSKNVEIIVPVINALSMAINSLKPDTCVLFSKLRERIDNHYLFLPFSASNFSSKFENEISSEHNDNKVEKYVYPKYINEKIYKFHSENIELIESGIKANNNFKSQIIEKNLESYKNIQRLKKTFKGTIHQRNFINKLATYLINVLDPFIEEMYEEGLLCENQAKIAAKIISFYKHKKARPHLEIKKKLLPCLSDLGLEALDRTFIHTYDNLFQFKTDNFSHENMFKFITTHILVKEWLSVIEFCYELKSEAFTENFIVYLFNLLKNYIKKLNECIDKKEKDSDYATLTWFINLGLVLSELVSRQNRFISLEVFDFKNAIQKSCILTSHEIIYFVSYFFLNSKNVIFNGKTRYVRKILHEIMAYKEDLPFLKMNLDLTLLEKNSIEEKSAFNYYLIEETSKRLSEFNNKYSEEDNLKRILADYYEFVYLPSNVVCKSEYLANYILPDNVYSSIIQMAIDVSVRDICKTLVDRIIKAIEKTIFEIQKLYGYKNIHNAFINLSMRLIHTNSYQPLRVCIKNNIMNFLKLCNLDINKISVNHIIESNLEICINLLKRETFTRINNNKFYKERSILEGKNLPNVEILNNLISYEPIVIKELKDEDLEKIKSKLTGITRDIPNTKLYVLTEQWRNFVTALESYEYYEEIDDLDQFCIEDTIAKQENVEKDIKERIKELSIKDAIIRNDKPKENKHPDVKYFSDLKLKKENLISHSKALLNLLINSDQIDSLAETLCKHIIGYLHYRVLHFMFLFLNEVFSISFYSYLIVRHYFLHSTTAFSKLIYYALENRIITVLEFDQLTALDRKELSQKVLELEIQRLKSIINLLVLRNKKLFTIYDFVYVLERVAKYNNISFVDHMVVNLKGYNLNESVELFEEFIRNNKFSYHKKVDFTDFVRFKKPEKIKQVIALDPSEENAFMIRELYNAFYFSWDHFLKFHRKHNDYSFLKLDTLIENCKENHLLMEVLSDMVDSSTSYDNLMFYKFMNRALGKFFVKVNKIVNFRKLSDEKNPFLMFLRGLIQIPHYVFFLFEYSPRSLKYAAIVIDLINLSPSLLNYAVSYFTDLYLYSFDNHSNEDSGKLEVSYVDGSTEYKFIPENDENVYLQSLDSAIFKPKLVMNKNFEYLKVKKQNILFCRCKNCEEINKNNPLLTEETEISVKKECHYRNKGYLLEDQVNALEILEKGCKKYFAVFSYLTSPKYPELKNLFMTTYIPNNEALKKIDYFKIRNLLNKNISAWAYRKYKGYVVAVVDSLLNNYFDEIRLIIKENYRITELINCLQARASCFNAPLCIYKALEIVEMSHLVKK
ncbi:NOT1-like general negative regulator of transcription subunit 1 [Tubulinosema ratisbonensis]|uniref:NOT1-like general negative regulator of transcription subunit 1 n=1 Tax=Tubulinosema ratisbonensis TaxID=291195 RepID=A0A437ANY1_9MICR|nr:NOT1-like general negative regulator of transcription subunit 1 [Tubulinosema ratisbonensis]